MFVKLETVKAIASEIIAENESAIDRKLTDWETTLVEVSIHKAIAKVKSETVIGLGASL
mgnify:CR=1 FL=1